MNTTILHKAMTILLVFLMFSSSIGFSMDIHFCRNELKSFSVFGNAEACEVMQTKQKKESTHACCKLPKKENEKCHNEVVAKGNCCHNESLIFDNGGEFETTNFSLQQFQQILIAALLIVPNFHLFQTSNKPVNFAHYNPPPLIKDVSILHQVFRI